MEWLCNTRNIGKPADGAWTHFQNHFIVDNPHYNFEEYPFTTPDQTQAYFEKVMLWALKKEARITKRSLNQQEKQGTKLLAEEAFSQAEKYQNRGMLDASEGVASVSLEEKPSGKSIFAN